MLYNTYIAAHNRVYLNKKAAKYFKNLISQVDFRGNHSNVCVFCDWPSGKRAKTGKLA